MRNVVCRTCGLVYLNPRPTAAELVKYYAGDYARDYKTNKRPLDDQRAWSYATHVSSGPGLPRSPTSNRVERWMSGVRRLHICRSSKRVAGACSGWSPTRRWPPLPSRSAMCPC